MIEEEEKERKRKKEKVKSIERRNKYKGNNQSEFDTSVLRKKGRIKNAK